MYMQSREVPQSSQHQLEAELLTEVRRAETEFKEAGPEQLDLASERYRNALRRFTKLVLDISDAGTPDGSASMLRDRARG